GPPIWDVVGSYLKRKGTVKAGNVGEVKVVRSRT
ncbi:MAG TPA: hypothetical protein PK264_15450, partial [Hyphomicrobiaceae bacterium]|nr:hypothetical protein [Hyphomicrobiaceae bacterium]